MHKTILFQALKGLNNGGGKAFKVVRAMRCKRKTHQQSKRKELTLTSALCLLVLLHVLQIVCCAPGCSSIAVWAWTVWGSVVSVSVCVHATPDCYRLGSRSVLLHLCEGWCCSAAWWWWWCCWRLSQSSEDSRGGLGVERQFYTPTRPTSPGFVPPLPPPGVCVSSRRERESNRVRLDGVGFGKNFFSPCSYCQIFLAWTLKGTEVHLILLYSNLASLSPPWISQIWTSSLINSLTSQLNLLMVLLTQAVISVRLMN